MAVHVAHIDPLRYDVEISCTHQPSRVGQGRVNRVGLVGLII